MGRFLFGVLILLTCASESFGHGSIVRGYIGNKVFFVTSQNELTASKAQATASGACTARGMTSCADVMDFKNSCVAIASTTGGLFSLGGAQDLQQATGRAIATCTSDHRTSCAVTLTACDTTPAPAAAETPAPEDDKFDYGGLFAALASINRIMATGYSLMVVAGTVLVALLPWTFASVVWTTPVAILKRKIAILLWIGGPAASTFIPWAFSLLDQAHLFLYAALTSLWASVYAALAIGVTGRRRTFPKSPTPDVLSLPLATLLFAIIAFGALYAFAQHGLIPNEAGCDSPHPLSSVCFHLEYEPIYVVGAVLMLLIMCGAALPANSNLILGYDRLTAFTRKGQPAFGLHSAPNIHSDNFEQAARGSQTARPANEASTDVSCPRGNPPIPDQTEEPQLDKKAVKEAFQRKRQQFDL